MPKEEAPLPHVQMPGFTAYVPFAFESSIKNGFKVGDVFHSHNIQGLNWSDAVKGLTWSISIADTKGSDYVIQIILYPSKRAVAANISHTELMQVLKTGLLNEYSEAK